MAAAMGARRAMVLALAAAALRAEGLESLVCFRPDAATWRRTQCGGANGTADIPSQWAADVSPAWQPLQEYPRPQMVRGAGGSPSVLRDSGDAIVWGSLNGLWEWQGHAPPKSAPPFGQRLSDSIMVPFPVESCLSGVAPRRSEDAMKTMWYRLTFDLAPSSARTLLHFGAVDWQTIVWMNGHELGNHTGGYDGFSFDVSDVLRPSGNELLLFVFDPSETGVQPHGKQFIHSISSPGGDWYTPSSGIWQTVWMERVPRMYIRRLKIDQASTKAVTITAELAGDTAAQLAERVGVIVYDPASGQEIAAADGLAGQAIEVQVPSPRMWSTETPVLYDVRIRTGQDEVLSYFGLRTFALGGGDKKRPLLNGNFTFLAGFLDQSFWPDGLYTAPSDEALEYDILAVGMFGLNMIRLHQKVNPERWYYYTDRHGVAVFQDAPQKYGDASAGTVPYFLSDLKAMIEGRRNHPSILQWTVFNEADCWEVFKPDGIKQTVDLVRSLDGTRLVDTDSGGDANKLGLGDVNDIHSYPAPADVTPSSTQYAMVGEFGGLGAFVSGKEWVAGKCFAYQTAKTPAEQADLYIAIAKTFASRADHVSAAVYTQTTDVEFECDGFLNYDRTNKFDVQQVAAIYTANRAIQHVVAGRVAVESDAGAGFPVVV